MNPLALSCCKNTGKPALLGLFMLLQEGKSEEYCAIQISNALSRNLPARIPQKTNTGLVAPEIGAATAANPERMKIANAINNPINNPIYRLIAKHAKERLMFGCTFDEFEELTIQEQRTRAQCGVPDGQCWQKRRREEEVE
jgi:hypothetical protein